MLTTLITQPSRPLWTRLTYIHYIDVDYYQCSVEASKDVIRLVCLFDGVCYVTLFQCSLGMSHKTGLTM
jgi:hypothetical protein